MIKAEVIGGETARAKFAERAKNIRPKLLAGMMKATIRLQTHVVRNKLSGQVLRVRTNNLRGSIHQTVTQEGGSIVGKVGTNVEYAAYHEYGFHGVQNVKEHLRTIRQVFGRPLSEPKAILIGAHARNVKYPARSFLRSALRDKEDEIKMEIFNTVKEVMK